MKLSLVDLPGTSGETQAELVSSRTAAIKHLRQGGAITASGDCGALNVWRADDGSWGCEFMKNRITADRVTFRQLGAVDQWLRDWFPKLDPSDH